jgi:large subunit ribosomal protein L4
MRSAPHWKGGGVVFGPHPRDFYKGFPKKMRRKALLSALSSRVSDGSFMVVEDFGITQAKTKEALALLTALNIQEKKVLVVLDTPTDELVRAFRNLPKVLLTTVESVGTYDVLDAECILTSRTAALRLQEVKQQPFGVDRWVAKQQEGGVA